MSISQEDNCKPYHNRKFRNNELTIQKAILKLMKIRRGRITAVQIAKEANISRQTLYEHYPDISTAPDRIERQIIVEFSNEVQKQINALARFFPDQNESVFYASFVFMAKRKDLFFQVCRDINNQRVLYRMGEIIYPLIRITWFPINAPTPQIGSERADMYISMIVEVIRKWGSKTNCNIKRSSSYINRLIMITAEASMRCK